MTQKWRSQLLFSILDIIFFLIHHVLKTFIPHSPHKNLEPPLLLCNRNIEFAIVDSKIFISIQNV